MQKMFQKQLLAILPILLSSLINADSVTKKGMYQQITSEILLKRVNVEQPSESEQKLINACRAASEFGTDYPEVPSETLKGVCSVDITRILSEYARTQTTFGYIGLAKRCAQMTDNVEVLQKRQSLIKHFDKNTEIVSRLEAAFKGSVKAEEALVRLFKHMDDKEKDAQEKLHNKVYFSSTGFKNCNESKAALEATFRLKSTLPLLPMLSILTTPTAMNFINAHTANEQSGKTTPIFSTILQSLGKSIKELPQTPFRSAEFIEMAYGFSKKTSMVLASLLIALEAKNVYTAGKEIKDCLDLIYKHQKDLIEIEQLIKSMEVVVNLIDNDPVLKNTLSAEHNKLAELFDPNSAATSSDLKRLINELNSSSFQGEGSYLLSKYGKILATHHLLNRIKGELIPYLEAFGDIDANLAIFKLYNEFKNHPRVKFCLPEFVNSNKPVLVAKEFWHPLISTDFVVTNDLAMGQNGAANLIITGPNAGGKTTSLMSLVINIIFAQSFGIAPSTSLKITPFAKIHSYLDITTNLSEGLSLFAAEVDRSKKLKQSILSCTPGQKTFTIIDELFSGTAPDVASNVGFQFASQLGDMTYSMSIITTHFPRLTALEKETKNFANYKVADAVIGSNGSITYPFKLVKGASTQNIAQQMLKNEGLI